MTRSCDIPADPARPGQSPPHLQRVYLEFYRLREPPFAITPDPEFLFLSQTHLSAIDKILYGIQSRMGVILLSGEVGTGKTTLCRVLLDRLEDRAVTVYLINPSFSGRELIAAILEDLGRPCPADATKKDLIDALNRFLLAADPQRPVVILIDDAQSLPLETMEDLRLLSNLETDKQKLLQVILAGQPELESRIGQPALRQLAQRVAIHCRLERLAPDEIQAYIARRLFVAGDQGQIRFPPRVAAKIHRITDGIPRMINKVCDLALTAAYTQGAHCVTAGHLRAAATELVGPQAKNHRRRRMAALRPAAACAAAALLLAGVCGLPAFPPPSSEKPAPMAAPQAAAAAGAPETAPAPGDTTAPDSGDEAAALAAGRGAFVLLLGSSRSLAHTRGAVLELRRQGVTAHWNPVDMGKRGLWYRIFTGRFEDRAAAERFKNVHGLTESLVLKAPLTLVLGEAERPEAFAPIMALLDENRYDAFVVAAGPNRYRLASGAYVSSQQAAQGAAELSRYGLNPRVVPG
ncbi:MAG: AAA family ATPase [Desulfobacteraceae bacterium]|nr:AAA family ATPase [Desulfobacteraceae bacterium]